MSNRNKINKEKYNNLKEAYEDLKRKLSFMELDYYQDKTVPSTTISLTNNENLVNQRNIDMRTMIVQFQNDSFLYY